MGFNFKSDTMRAFVVHITPDLAKQMLATSPGNRRLRSWWVDMLAMAMRRGEWRTTHQGGVFDWDGHLRDSHHRLQACIKAGVPIPMMMTVGMDPAAMDAIDVGVGRSVADILELDKRVAEPLRFATGLVRHTRRVTIAQIQVVADGGVLEALQALIDDCGSTRAFFTSAPLKLAAVIAMMNGEPPDFVMAQYRALATMDFDSMTQAAKALVRQVTTAGHKTRSDAAYEALARGLRVFERARSGVTRIQVSDADIAAALATCRTVLMDSIGENRPEPPARGKPPSTHGGVGLRA